ncbi:MAG: OmpA family protein, partial [Candidatus Cryptobacteroides sp.]|nr:OmpA family protein [Candidatus Cryptobacteroides sp.]
LDAKKAKKEKKDNKGTVQAAEAAPVAAAWTCPNPECGHTGNTGRFCTECGTQKPGAESAAKKVATEYAKSDFVPGDEIFFDDDFANEQLGEFPLRWELLDGYVETASVAGRKVLAFTDNGIGQVLPNMKEKWAWLPEDFTVEYDLFIAPLTDEDASTLSLRLCFGAPGQSDYYNADSEVTFQYREDGSSSISWSLTKPDGNNQIKGNKALGLSDNYTDYAADSPVKPGEWNHFAFSFNKRAFKGYINGVRLINVPAMQAPGYLFFLSGSPYRFSGISNVRIAKGAVPLYDRLMTDGKIITYAITFETGKADLKPESMVEILRVAKLMKENPGLEFEVQGHCDSTGSDKVNDPLSQKRAEAIVAALVEQDIAETRLTPVGKGSHVPIAPNSTEEGRARNRRVEFVKK